MRHGDATPTLTKEEAHAVTAAAPTPTPRRTATAALPWAMDLALPHETPLIAIFSNPALRSRLQPPSSLHVPDSCSQCCGGLLARSRSPWHEGGGSDREQSSMMRGIENQQSCMRCSGDHPLHGVSSTLLLKYYGYLGTATSILCLVRLLKYSGYLGTETSILCLVRLLTSAHASDTWSSMEAQLVIRG